MNELEKAGWVLEDSSFYECPEELKAITPEFDAGPDPRPGCEGRTRPEFTMGTYYGFNPRKVLAIARQQLAQKDAQIKGLQSKLDACVTAGFDVENPHEHGRLISKDRDTYIGWVKGLVEALEFAHAAAVMTYDNGKKQAFFDKYRKRYAKNGCFSQQIIIDALADALFTLPSSLLQTHKEKG